MHYLNELIKTVQKFQDMYHLIQSTQNLIYSSSYSSSLISFILIGKDID